MRGLDLRPLQVIPMDVLYSFGDADALHIFLFYTLIISRLGESPFFFCFYAMIRWRNTLSLRLFFLLALVLISGSDGTHSTQAHTHNLRYET